MKIYFAGSIRGGREDAALYKKLIKHLQQYGEVLTEHIGDDSLENVGEIKMNDAHIHDRDLNWIIESDVVIAEVSTPSLGVGYEIGRAIENGKTVVCLYKLGSQKRLSAMIAGSPEIINMEYLDFTEAVFKLDRFFAANLKP